MLTKLEVSGFKNLIDLSIELGPFTCIAGANGTGKSNVFDAIQFLSLLADKSMMDAAQQVRGVHDERSGDPRDLFWDGYSTETHRMTFAAEMIVPQAVEDDFGRQAKPTTTFLRYELELGYQAPTGIEKIGRLTLLSESLRHINKGDARAHMNFPHSAKKFRDKVVQGRRSGIAFISTATDQNGEPIISIHQDGGSRGQPKPAAASRAPATVVSTVTSSDDPTILAVRREMQSWRRIALEPSSLRSTDRYVGPRSLTADGLHLPATLFRIAHRLHPDDPSRTYARVAGRLSDLAGLGVKTLEVVEDDVREMLTVRLYETSGLALPARSLSEGTLRFLALCVLLEDPEFQGLMCMEEPENGIHPANLPPMVDLVRTLAVDPTEEVDEENPLRQVLINTHSPGVVQLVDPGDLLFADTSAFRTTDGSIARGLRLRPLVGTWRAEKAHGNYVTKADILPYLTTPPDAQLTLQWEAV
ncbi:AAA family ATPase [Streptomyces sp. Midd1]|uniref:AAA family ATPase n=1 Tax=Streptomyces sp. Midd3 TaxID=3161191 RepID=UPI0034DAC4EC